jgi:hypothetical protein
MEIPEFNEIKEQLSELKNLITANKSNNKEDLLAAYWYNDQRCCELKGGMALSTYRSNRYYQCKGGIPDAKVGGRKVWSKESVMEWIKLSDDELPAYHDKYKTGATKR